MAIRHHRSVWFGLSAVASVLALAGCAAPAQPERAGELELQLDPAASYSLVGRFHVNAIEPWSPSRDIDFDAATSSARLALPTGRFTLTLAAGARLVCAGDDTAPFVDGSTVPRLVSAPPQFISVAPGELTSARIAFGAPLAPNDATHVDFAEAPDPCGTRLDITDAVASRR
ncbi:MAG TPA: hypothetical protein VMG12_18650 [Polyangiaceae bacterium]|nr:hypothetical protein [Polyangiaceae bacterium]